MPTPPSFSSGAVLTSAQMNQAGLWRVRPTSATNGTINADDSVTVGNTVGSVTLSGVFTSSFRNYRVTWTGGLGSSNGSALRLTVNGATSTNYNYGGYYAEYSTATIGGSGSTSASYWVIGEVSNVAMSVLIDFYAPQVTSVYTQMTVQTTGHQYGRTMHGHDTSASVSTAFTITPNAGTITGGIIKVYGYN